MNNGILCPYRSVSGVYMLLISMADRIRVLAKRTGTVGEKAKVINSIHENICIKRLGTFLSIIQITVLLLKNALYYCFMAVAVNN